MRAQDSSGEIANKIMRGCMQHNAHIDMMHIIQYTVRLNGFMCTFNMHSYRRTCIREGKGRGGGGALRLS